MWRNQLLLIGSIAVLMTSLPECDAYRILGIFPFNARSHMMMFEQLMKGLARRGHQVDVVSTFPQTKTFPNYTDIVIPATIPNYVNNLCYESFRSLTPFYTVQAMAIVGNKELCESGLRFHEIQRLIEDPPRDPPYDLVITEIFSASCFMAFGRHLKVPVIGVCAAVLYPWVNNFIANPENLAFVPSNLLKNVQSMSFLNRLYNVVHNNYAKFLFNTYTTSQSELTKNHFGFDSSDIRSLEKDIALILTNSHMSLNDVKPTTPALIEVGGLHIQDDDSTIPAEHKTWLDESEDGFIYFSFGSMVTIESFPEDILQNIYESFRKIHPIRVFMKVPRPQLLPPGLPTNVRTFSWIPQLKVLKHQNIRGFITHGGLLGTQEAISCAVPMIGIPLFSDQFFNIDLYVRRRIAVRLDYLDLTTVKLGAALNEVLHNPVYRKMALKVSKEFLDRPLSPLDEACYWVEYVIRHGGKALRSPALEFSWWQIALLDVYSFIIITCIATLLLLITTVQFSIKIVRGHQSNVTLSKKCK